MLDVITTRPYFPDVIECSRMPMVHWALDHAITNHTERFFFEKVHGEPMVQKTAWPSRPAAQCTAGFSGTPRREPRTRRRRFRNQTGRAARLARARAPGHRGCNIHTFVKFDDLSMI